MSSSIEEDGHRPFDRVRSGIAETVEALRVDLRRFHAAWMERGSVNELGPDSSVVEGWKPRSTRGLVRYRLWAALGVVLVAVAYPLYVLGLATRYYARRLDRLSASLGLAGVVGLSIAGWGALTAATYLSPIAYEGFVVVAVASVVATASAALALVSARWRGRVSTVAVSYPLGVTALFLPPVVASLYSPTLAAIVFPHSTSLAVWLLDTVLRFGGIAGFIRASFELEGVAYVGMWFALAVPVGWLLGIVATLAGLVRPGSTEPARSIDDGV